VNPSFHPSIIPIVTISYLWVISALIEASGPKGFWFFWYFVGIIGPFDIEAYQGFFSYRQRTYVCSPNQIP